MIVVLAIDALEYNKVLEYSNTNLLQEYYGKTNISEFSEPRTMVLWSSFLTGQNKESEVLLDGQEEMWGKKLDISETFLSNFENPVVFDLPGFSYNLEVHKKSRSLLKNFFEAKDFDEKKQIREEYNADAFQYHKQVKENFFQALNADHDFVLGYFSSIDVIGHLNFGNNVLMKLLYTELDEIAKQVRSICDYSIILSDHGMKPIGFFGDHSEYGFWSTNFKNLGTPKITEFYDLLFNLKKK